MNESDRERTKLLATALNNLGVATLTIGVVAPGIAYLYDVGPVPSLPKLVTFSGLFLAFA